MFRQRIRILMRISLIPTSRLISILLKSIVLLLLVVFFPLLIELILIEFVYTRGLIRLRSAVALSFITASVSLVFSLLSILRLLISNTEVVSIRAAWRATRAASATTGVSAAASSIIFSSWAIAIIVTEAIIREFADGVIDDRLSEE